MKTFILFIAFLIAISNIKGQDYQISFTASGQSSNIDSIHVENLSQGTTISLNGNDALHLVGTLGINTLINNEKNVKIYPNPLIESTIVEFINQNPQTISLEVFNELSTLIVKKDVMVQNGPQKFKISGLNAGIYTFVVSSKEWTYSAKIISLGEKSKNATIKQQSVDLGSTHERAVESTKDLVEMQYNDGEIILFKGFSGDYARVLTLLPTQSQAVNFEFIPCSDDDGNNYAVVTIGTQTWMAENLNYETADSWWYNNSSVNGAIYGRLYKWYAALTACPSGWHLPSDDEWKTLEMFLGMSQSQADQTGWRGTDEGGKMKETGITHWDSPNTGAENSSGFTALPGGYRYGNMYFGKLGSDGYWWSSTQHSSITTEAWTRSLRNEGSTVGRNFHSKQDGFSVRCLRD